MQWSSWGGHCPAEFSSNQGLTWYSRKFQAGMLELNCKTVALHAGLWTALNLYIFISISQGCPWSQLGPGDPKNL